MSCLPAYSWFLPEQPLPGVAQEIADVIGRYDTLRLIDQLPAAGSRNWRVCVYVPKTMPPDHKLIRILGWAKAERLRRHFGGEILQPSNCRYLLKAQRQSAVWFLARSGVDRGEIAEWLGLSRYRVNEILRGNPPEGNRGGSVSSRKTRGVA
jgi:hypothetical protein